MIKHFRDIKTKMILKVENEEVIEQLKKYPDRYKEIFSQRNKETTENKNRLKE